MDRTNSIISGVSVGSAGVVTSTSPPDETPAVKMPEPAVIKAIGEPALSASGMLIAGIGTKATPRDDQKTAIDDVVKGFSKYRRGQLILPCGTGKTLTSLWVKEKICPKRTLNLYPSLSLLKQTKDEWEEHKNTNFEYLCVCSDVTVDKKPAKKSDEDEITDVDLGQQVTSSAEEIRQFLLSGDNDKVLHCTYQSIELVIEALKDSNLKFDLVFADEAHKTAGSADKLFSFVHDDALIKANKRLYMTATPRVLGEKEKMKV